MKTHKKGNQTFSEDREYTGIRPQRQYNVFFANNTETLVLRCHLLPILVGKSGIATTLELPSPPFPCLPARVSSVLLAWHSSSVFHLLSVVRAHERFSSLRDLFCLYPLSIVISVYVIVSTPITCEGVSVDSSVTVPKPMCLAQGYPHHKYLWPSPVSVCALYASQ